MLAALRLWITGPYHVLAGLDVATAAGRPQPAEVILAVPSEADRAEQEPRAAQAAGAARTADGPSGGRSAWACATGLTRN